MNQTKDDVDVLLKKEEIDDLVNMLQIAVGNTYSDKACARYNSLITKLRSFGRSTDGRCPERESGGARCEREAGHPSPCVCPQALEEFKRKR